MTMVVEQRPPLGVPVAQFGPPHGSVERVLATSLGPALRSAWEFMPAEFRGPSVMGVEPGSYGVITVHVGSIAYLERFRGQAWTAGIGGVFMSANDMILTRSGIHLIHEWGHFVDFAWRKRVDKTPTRERLTHLPFWLELFADVKATTSGTQLYAWTNEMEFFAELFDGWCKRSRAAMLTYCNNRPEFLARAVGWFEEHLPFAGMEAITQASSARSAGFARISAAAVATPELGALEAGARSEGFEPPPLGCCPTSSQDTAGI